MSILIGIVGLGLLVFIHEGGHFLTARAVGMSPRKFYIGFPPAIVKTMHNGIEYGIGAIPLGGYVKIPGMHRPAPSDVDVRLRHALTAAPELTSPLESVKRALARDDQQAARAALAELDNAMRAAGQSTTALDDVRDALSPDAYWRAPAWKRVLVIFAGPGTNALFAIVIFAVLFMIGGGKATTTVGEVLSGTPAAHVGLEPGDTILAIDGKPVSPSDIPTVISSSHGKPLSLAVQRAGRLVDLGPVRPQRTAGVYRLGFILKGKGLGPLAASWESVHLTGIVSWDIMRSLGNLVHQSGRKQISSPVGIVQGSSTAVKQGFQSYLWVLGLISLSLALLNLLPLLPLDGGHIFFSLLEAVRGKAVGREVYERVSAIGIGLVLLLFFIGLSNDVGRIGGG
ncbi:MAG: M50 family metallopeptidase [Gaiellaceae bacterium]